MTGSLQDLRGKFCKREGGGNGIKQGGRTQRCNQKHWNRDAGRRTAKLTQAQQNYIISRWSSLTPRLYQRKVNHVLLLKIGHKDLKACFYQHDLTLRLWNFGSQKQDRTDQKIFMSSRFSPRFPICFCKSTNIEKIVCNNKNLITIAANTLNLALEVDTRNY